MKALLMELLGNKSLLFAVEPKKEFKSLSNKDQTEYAGFLLNSFKWLAIYFHQLFNNEKEELSLSQHQAYSIINDLYKKAIYRAIQLKVPGVKMCSRKLDLERKLSKVNVARPYNERKEAETIIKAFQALIEEMAYGLKYSNQEISEGVKLGAIKLLREAMKFEVKTKSSSIIPLTLGQPVFTDFESIVKNSSDKLSSFVSLYPSELKIVTGKKAFGG